MNGLIDHIESNDPDFVTLTLTMECENDDELLALIDALEHNTTLQQVAFRESFFPLRNIRRHLSWNSFLRMLEAVGSKAVNYVFLPPSMMGMIRAQTASHLLFDNNACLQEFRANEALTFGTPQDVEILAECLGECQHLRSVELGDSFFNRSSRAISEHMMDPLLLKLAELSELRQFELSSHYAQHISARKPPLLSSHALQHFLQKSSSTLQLLNLSRLGLGDDHFEAIALYFSSSNTSDNNNDLVAGVNDVPTLVGAGEVTNENQDPEDVNENNEIFPSSSLSSYQDETSQEEDSDEEEPVLLRFCLDGNRPTASGVATLFRSLQHNPPVQSLSLRRITSTYGILSTTISKKEWSERIFASNYNLTELEIDEHENTMLLGGTTNNRNDGDVTEFWTHLNGLQRRQAWSEDSFSIRSSLWPLVLEEVASITGDPSFTWFVLRNFSQYIIQPP